MDPYISFAEYVSISKNPYEIDEATFDLLYPVAKMVVDSLTMYKIELTLYHGYETMPAWIRQRVTEAMSVEITTIEAQGGSSIAEGMGAESEIRGGTIGTFKYFTSNNRYTASEGSATVPTINGVPISPMIEHLLFPTGMLYRGLGCNG